MREREKELAGRAEKIFGASALGTTEPPRAHVFAGLAATVQSAGQEPSGDG